MMLVLGAVLSVLIIYKLAFLRVHPTRVFGETMMLVYYAYAMPLSLKIGRGFYADGIWADGGFVPYSTIGGLALDGKGRRLAMSHYGGVTLRYALMADEFGEVRLGSASVKPRKDGARLDCVALAAAELDDPRLAAYRTGLVVTIAGLCLVGWAVHFWNATLALFMFILGSGAWMLDAKQPGHDHDAPGAAAPRRTAGRSKQTGRRLSQRP